MHIDKSDLSECYKFYVVLTLEGQNFGGET